MPPSAPSNHPTSTWLAVLQAFFALGVCVMLSCLIALYSIGTIFGPDILRLHALGGLGTGISQLLALFSIPAVLLVATGTAPLFLVAGALAGIALQFVDKPAWYLRILYAALTLGCLVAGVITAHLLYGAKAP